MGLLGDIAGRLMGGGGGQQGLAAAVIEMLGNQQGGIAGLAESFQRNGLGEIASSWIGTGANLPVSADQIRQVLGSGQVQALAEKAGLSGETVGPLLTQLLPTIVDKLTPGGQIPERGDMLSAGAELLQSLLGGR